MARYQKRSKLVNYVYAIIQIMKITSPKRKTSQEYKGTIVMSVDDQTYVTRQTKKVPALIKKIEEKHHKKPLITIVPKEGTLILRLS